MATPGTKRTAASGKHWLASDMGVAVIATLTVLGIGLGFLTYGTQEHDAAFWIGAVTCLISAGITISLWGRFAPKWRWIPLVLCGAQLIIIFWFAWKFFQSPVASTSGPSTDPRLVLASEGIPFTPESFNNAVETGDLNASKLFFKAGYSPNRIDGSYFVSTMAMINDPTDFPSVIELLRQNGLDYKAVNHTPNPATVWLNRPLTQEEELFALAAGSRDSSELVAELKNQGANPSSLISGLKRDQATGDFEDLDRMVAALTATP